MIKQSQHWFRRPSAMSRSNESVYINDCPSGVGS